MIRSAAVLLTVLPRIILLMGGVGPNCGVRGVAAQEPRSPVIAELHGRTADADTLVIDAFWARVAQRFTPIVEPLSGTDSILVTFLWRGNGETRNVLVYGALTGWLPPANVLERLPRTDAWYLTVAARADIRFSYRMAENDVLRTYWEDPSFAERARRFRPDPLNPDTVPLGAAGQSASHMTGLGFLPGRWTSRREPQAGRRDTLVLNDRTICVYVPPLRHASDEVGLVVTLDGRAYDSLVSTPGTVEALVEAGVVAPVIVVMIESRDRSADLSPNEPFAHFVSDTLLPELANRFAISRDPARSVIVGSSLGGLAAAWLAYRLPDRFGNVIAQSGAYWWAPPGDGEGGWLPRLFAQGERRPLRVYLDAGILETQPVRGGVSMLALTQHFRDVLCARGYEVAYRTFPGGHEYEQWRATLPGALTWALGRSSTAPRRQETESVGEICHRLVNR